jgi:hydroxymethylglutaryl-CoA synthase
VASAPAPSSFGIEAMAVYIPVNRVAQPDLEKMHSCEGKYTRGLGQRAIAVPAANEDSVSMAFTALSRLMVAAGEPTDIGFLAVATESMVDRSKSIKSELVDRLGLTDTEGTDVYHACYGSTAAILWALDWLASGRGHGKRAIVVCTDIAEWGPEYCVLNGAASVALLLGPNPVVQLDASTSATISYNGHDFCKPLEQPYPVFDGPDSVESLTNVLRKCLARVPWGNSDFSYLVPHCTTAMMCRRASDTAADFFGVPAKDRASYFAAKVDPCTHWVRDIGSMFTAAMWVNLACLLSQGQAVNTNIALFSYGSGTMGTLWRARVVRALPAGSALIVAPEGVDTPSVSPSQCSALVRWQSAEEWLQLQRSTKMLAPSTAFALIGEEQVGRRKYALAEDADAGGGAA